MEYTEENLPKKVEAMFQAVIDMINDGSDINTMKVQDITKRAGIGKGTAYEYFASKEELIGEAIDWDFQSAIQKLREKVECQEDFRGKIFCILECLEMREKTHQNLMHMMGTSANSCCISQNMKATLKNSCYPALIQNLLDDVMNAGVSEGILNGNGSEYNKRTSLISQLVMFLMYLKHQNGQIPGTDFPISETLAEVKERIYQNLLILNS